MSSDQTRISIDRLERYFRGECSPEERIQIAELVGRDAGLQAMASAIQGDRNDPDLLWERFQTRRATQNLIGRSQNKPSGRTVFRTSWLGDSRRWAAIAALILVTLGSFAGYHRLTAPKTERIVATRTYQTASGQRAYVKLPDGSGATLAPYTHLRYIECASGERDLALEGRAYFTVTAQANRSFVVRTGDVATRVLGTEFEVAHYPTESATRVAVTQGRVSVARKGFAGGVVESGMLATVSDSNGMTMTPNDNKRYTAWTTGVLMFDNTPARDMLAAIGQWYGWEFRLADSTLAKHEVTAHFDGDSQELVLKSLSALLNVTMTFDHNVITLHPRRVRSAAPARQWPNALLKQRTEVGR